MYKLLPIFTSNKWEFYIQSGILFTIMPELKELSKMLRIKFITVENISRPALLSQLGWREINLVSCPTSMTIWEGESARRSLVLKYSHQIRFRLDSMKVVNSLSFNLKNGSFSFSTLHWLTFTYSFSSSQCIDWFIKWSGHLESSWHWRRVIKV